MTDLFKGTATAMVTPFKENGKINFSMLGKLIERQIEGGTDAIVLLGTTGEPSALTECEKTAIVDFAVRLFKGKIKIVVGCGSNCTATAVGNAKRAEERGADGLIAVTPYYNKCTQNGLYLYYRSICEAVKLPVIAYSVPSRTGVTIAPETALRLCGIGNFAGIKDAGGDMRETLKTLRSIGGKASLYCGEDILNLPVLASGGAGVISVVGNLFPKAVKDLSLAVRDGKMHIARQISERLLPVTEACFSEVNPIPVKAALEIMGLSCGAPRPPLTPAEPQTVLKIRTALSDYLKGE